MIDDIAIARFFSQEDLATSRSYTYLYKLKNLIVPNGTPSTDGAYNFISFVEYLDRHPKHAELLSQYLKQLFGGLNLIRVFTELGIPRNDGFIQQVLTRITGHFLPEIRDRQHLEFIFELLFPTKSDGEWVELIDNETFIHFLKLLNLSEIYQIPSQHKLMLQILNSIEVVSLRIAALGISVDVVDKLPELEQYGSPFISQVEEISSYLKKFQLPDFDRSTQNIDYRQIMILINQCDQYVQKLSDKKQLFGVSLKLTNYILRLTANLKRLRLLLYLITLHNDDKEFNEEVVFLKKLVLSHCRDKSVAYLVRSNLDLMLYQMTLHSSQKGQKYIATDFKEMLTIFLSSCGGGAIIAALAMVKQFLMRISFSYFFQGFFFSLNYAFGFCLIHLLSFRLATKQPAMIASHMAEAIDISNNSKDRSLLDLRLIMRQLLQSQLFSFLGNIVIALPIALIISKLFEVITGETFLTADEADYILRDINPFTSLSVYYASITGIYLFVSEFATSYFENLNLRNKLGRRIRYIQFLQKKFSTKQILQISKYIDHNIGALIGNCCLGLLLGFSLVVGKIFGIPLDIRHITFSAAKLGMTLAHNPQLFDFKVLIISTFGIVSIGLFNFMFSFIPSLLVAMISRGVSFTFFIEFFYLLRSDFIKGPLQFFTPLKNKLDLLKRDKNDN